MIEPTEADIGRKVYYVQHWMKLAEYEAGVITGFNETYVHVRYGSDMQSKSTARRFLYWEGNTP